MRSSQEFLNRLESEHRRIRRKAKEDASDRLVMRLPPLGLLRGGMHVAEAALERAVVEDRRSTGAVIERVDDLAGLVNGPGRGEADHRVLIEAQLAGLADRFPDLGEAAQQEGARRAKPRLGLRPLRLDPLVRASPRGAPRPHPLSRGAGETGDHAPRQTGGRAAPASGYAR